MTGLSDQRGSGTIGILNHPGSPDGNLTVWFDVRGPDRFDPNTLGTALAFSENVATAQSVQPNGDPLLPTANVRVTFKGGAPSGQTTDAAIGYNFGEAVVLNGLAVVVPETARIFPTGIVILVVAVLVVLVFLWRRRRSAA